MAPGAPRAASTQRSSDSGVRIRAPLLGVATRGQRAAEPHGQGEGHKRRCAGVTVGMSSGQCTSQSGPYEPITPANVAMHVPTVCLINLSASPIPASSSALSAAACAGGMVWLWRRTLFFRMRPAAMRIATGRSVSRMKTCATVWLNSGTVCSWSSCAFTAACTAESGTCACSSMVTTCPTAVASGCHAILSPAAAAAPDTRSTRVSAPAGLSRRLSGPLLTVSRPYSASAHPPGRRDPARAWARPPQLGRPFHGASGGHRHLCERTTVSIVRHVVRAVESILPLPK